MDQRDQLKDSIKVLDDFKEEEI